MLISPFGGFKEGKLSPLNRYHEGKGIPFCSSNRFLGKEKIEKKIAFSGF